MRFDQQQAIRHMFIAGGATEYPTGKTLGAQGPGGATVVAAAGTKTATAGSSIFLVKGIRGAWIHSIIPIDAASATGNIEIETQGGTTLGIVIPVNAAGRLEFPGGIYIAGGFRVISATTGDFVLTYELDGEPKSVPL